MLIVFAKSVALMFTVICAGQSRVACSWRHADERGALIAAASDRDVCALAESSRCLSPRCCRCSTSALHRGRLEGFRLDPLEMAPAFLHVSSNMMKVGMRVYSGTERLKSERFM